MKTAVILKFKWSECYWFVPSFGFHNGTKVSVGCQDRFGFAKDLLLEEEKGYGS